MINGRTMAAVALFCFQAIAPESPMAQSVGLSDVIGAVERSFSPGTTGVAPIADVSTDFFQRTTLAGDNREMRAEGQMYFRAATPATPPMYRFDYFRPARQEIVCDGRSLWIYHPENREVMLGDVSFLYNRSNYMLNNRPVNMLDGLSRISRDFQIIFAQGMTDAKGNYVLELLPRSAMNYRRILMVVNRESVFARAQQSQAGGSSPPPAAFPPQSSFTSRPSAFPSSQPGHSPFPAAAPQPSRAGFGPPASAMPSREFQYAPFPVMSTTAYDHQGNVTTMEFFNSVTNTRLSDMTFMFSVPPGVQVVRPSEKNLPR